MLPIHFLFSVTLCGFRHTRIENFQGSIIGVKQWWTDKFADRWLTLWVHTAALLVCQHTLQLWAPSPGWAHEQNSLISLIPSCCGTHIALHGCRSVLFTQPPWLLVAQYLMHCHAAWPLLSCDPWIGVESLGQTAHEWKHNWELPDRNMRKTCSNQDCWYRRHLNIVCMCNRPCWQP